MWGQKSEDYSAEHCAHSVHHILSQSLICLLLQVCLGVHLTNAGHQELLSRLLRLVLNPLVVLSGQFAQALQSLHIAFLLVCVGIKLETVGPARLVQVQQHLLLTLILAVIDSDRVVHFVETVDLGDGRWTLQVADIRGSLAGLNLCHHDFLWDSAESIDHDLTLD